MTKERRSWANWERIAHGEVKRPRFPRVLEASGMRRRDRKGGARGTHSSGELDTALFPEIFVRCGVFMTVE